jgi:diaminohydroxyphosphoribosylaminopyrimidine deaminase/5-amino-6-(5-phosphoribosylamino)uracil reductase
MVKGKNPFRVVIDSGLRTNVNAKVYRDRNVLVATTAASPLKYRGIFQKKGIELLVYKGRSVPLKLLLKDLYKRGFCHVMTEAGSGLVTSLVKMQLADELILFIAPKILGKGLSWVDDLGIGHLERLLKLGNVQTKRFGEDVMISGRFEYQV